MALAKTEKQNYEAYFIYSNFETVMAVDETIESFAVTAVDSSGADATDVLIESGSAQVLVDNPHRVYFRIQGGEEASSMYKFTTRIVTSTGNQWEVDGNVKVKEL